MDDSDRTAEAVAGPTLRPSVDAKGISLTIIAIGVAIALLKYMAEVFIPLVLAVLAFYALDPLVDRLQRWHVPRWLGSAIAILTLVGSVTVGVLALGDDAERLIAQVPAASQKLRATMREARRGQTSGTLDRIQEAAEEIKKTAAEASGDEPQRGVQRVEVTTPAFSATDYVWWGSTQALVWAGQAIMILFLAYFLLLSDDLFKRKLVEIIGPTLASKKLTVEILNQVAVQIERFLLVQILTSAIVGVVTGVVLWWLGVQQPGLWGLIAGVFNSIPYFGALIVTGVLTLVGFLQFGTITMALTIGGATLLVTSLEGWLLTPTLMGRVAQINTVAVFVSLIFWSWMWGVAGLLLAVPMTMAVKATCDRVDGLQAVGKVLGE